MSDWIDISRWPDCAKMERPGIIFEVRNGLGQSLMTPCVVPMPALPFDWTSPPVMFRAVEAPAPRHSDPMPEPPKI
jgi:hypothetical protein